MTDTNSPKPSAASAREGSLRHELSEDASRLKDAAGHRANREVRDGERKAASAANYAASAIEQAAGSLREDEDAPVWLASALENTARKISGFAGAIEGRSLADMHHDINHFARENPGAFLAASAAAGFAAARFLRAGGAYRAHHRQEGAGRPSGNGASSVDGSAEDVEGVDPGDSRGSTRHGLATRSPDAPGGVS